MPENNLFAQSTMTTSERIRIHQPRSDDSVVSGGCRAAAGLIVIQAEASFLCPDHGLHSDEQLEMRECRWRRHFGLSI